MMPLSIDININGHCIETVWIARIESFKGNDQVHEYIVGVGTQVTPPWSSAAGDPLPQFPHFYHRYSDGATMCVERALTALRSIKPDVNVCGAVNPRTGKVCNVPPHPDDEQHWTIAPNGEHFDWFMAI